MPVRLAALLLLTAAAAGAQTAFEPGYIVVRGDTLRGEVALGSELEARDGARFRIGGEVREVRPGDADAFGVWGGRHYRGGPFRVRPGSDPGDAPALREGYARVARDGPTSLLAFEARDRAPVFFVEATDGERIGLYRVETGGGPGRAARILPLYRQALLTTLGTCAGDPGAFSDLAYTETAIAARVDAANVCVDASYAPAAAPAPRRASIFDGVEIGAGVAVGRFERLRGPPRASTDPTVLFPSVRAAVVLRTPPVPWLRIVADVSLSSGVLDYSTFGSRGFTVRRVTTAHVGAGLRASRAVGATRVGIGAGLFGGTNLVRVVDDEATLADDDGSTVWDVPAAEFEASGGQYLEVSVGLGLPLTVVSRAQRTVFSQGPFYFPGTQGYRYKTETVSLGARFAL